MSDEESSKLNKKVLHKLEDILRKEFPSNKFEYTIESASSKGDNYIGLLYRVNVELDINKKFKLIVKVMPTNPARRKYMFVVESFTHEAFAYEQIFPLLIEFQKSKGLKENVIFDAFPSCYGIISEEYNEAIFLEDLCEKGYRIFDRFEDIDEEHVRLVMQAYGQLHAVSFALADQQPEKLEKYNTLKEAFMNNKDDKMFTDYFDNCLKRSLNSLSGAADARYKEKFLKFLANKNTFTEYLKYLGAETKDPYSVFCHGDCWNNNIIFLYNEHQQPVKVSLLDWQNLRYASPITDLMYYLFNSTSRRFRSKNFKKMIDLYYQSLSEHLRKLGSSPDKVFPRSTFEQKLKQFGVSGFYFALISLPTRVAVPEETPDLDDLAEKYEEGVAGIDFFVSNNDKLYDEIMSGIIKDTIDFGLLCD